MVKAFFISFFSGLLIISIAHNSYQTEQSYKRCKAEIAQIHQHADNLNNL